MVIDPVRLSQEAELEQLLAPGDAQVETERLVMTSRPVAERAAEELGVNDPRDVLEDVEAQPIVETRVVRVVAQDPDPAAAAATADAFASAYLAHRREQAVAAEVAVSAVTPQPVRTGALAAVLGLLLGVGLAFLRDHLDDVVREENDVKRATDGRPILGRIPEWNDPEGGNRMATIVDLTSPTSEAYREPSAATRFLLIADGTQRHAVDAVHEQRDTAILGGLAAGVPLIAMVAPLGVYLADASLTLVRRVARGVDWQTAHKEHVYQRLVQAGWSHARVTSVVAGVVALCASLGLAGPALDAVGPAVGALAIVMIGYLALPVVAARADEAGSWRPAVQRGGALGANQEAESRLDADR